MNAPHRRPVMSTMGRTRWEPRGSAVTAGSRLSKGSVLVEILIALVLTATGFAGIATTSMTTMRADAKGQRVSSAIALARTKLEQLRTLPRTNAAWAAGAHEELHLDDGGAVASPGIYARRWTVEPSWNGRPRLARVSVTVAWQEQVERSVTLASLYW